MLVSQGERKVLQLKQSGQIKLASTVELSLQ